MTGTGGGAEIHAELARDDLRERRLAEARRADEEHMVERFARAPRAASTKTCRLARAFAWPTKSASFCGRKRGVLVLAALVGGDEATGAHRASSLRPSRIRRAVSAPSPASRIAAAIAAEACICP